MLTTKLKRNSGLKNKEAKKENRKSAFTLFREKYPNGVGEIVDMRAVLR